MDFKVTKVLQVPDQPYLTMLVEKRITPDEMVQFERSRNNVIAEIRLELEVRK